MTQLRGITPGFEVVTHHYASIISRTAEKGDEYEAMAKLVYVAVTTLRSIDQSFSEFVVDQ